MTTFKQFLENEENNNIFPKMGELPIPEGCVRLYHQTNEENVPSIKENGILKKFATGKSSHEPAVIWATRKPFYSDKPKKGLATVEFFVPENEFISPSYVTSDKVPPENILAIHEWWQKLASNFIEDYPEPEQNKIEDWMSIDEHHKKAAEFYVNYMKSKGKL